LFATGLWLAATVASTSIVWMATSLVAADVTDRPATLVAHQEVVSELASGSDARSAPTSTTQKANAPTPTVPAPGRAAPPLSPNAPLPTTPASRTAGATIPPPSPSTTTTTVPGARPGPRPTNPAPSQPAPRPTATYSTSGGAVRVACNGFFIELISAIPSNGYAVKVVASGPANVDVRFIGSSQELSVKAVCYGQPIRYYEQSPPRQTQGSP